MNKKGGIDTETLVKLILVMLVVIAVVGFVLFQVSPTLKSRTETEIIGTLQKFGFKPQVDLTNSRAVAIYRTGAPRNILAYAGFELSDWTEPGPFAFSGTSGIALATADSDDDGEQEIMAVYRTQNSGEKSQLAYNFWDGVWSDRISVEDGDPKTDFTDGISLTAADTDGDGVKEFWLAYRRFNSIVTMDYASGFTGEPWGKIQKQNIRVANFAALPDNVNRKDIALVAANVDGDPSDEIFLFYRIKPLLQIQGEIYYTIYNGGKWSKPILLDFTNFDESGLVAVSGNLTDPGQETVMVIYGKNDQMWYSVWDRAKAFTNVKRVKELDGPLEGLDSNLAATAGDFGNDGLDEVFLIYKQDKFWSELADTTDGTCGNPLDRPNHVFRIYDNGTWGNKTVVTCASAADVAVVAGQFDSDANDEALVLTRKSFSENDVRIYWRLYNNNTISNRTLLTKDALSGIALTYIPVKEEAS